MNMAKPLWIFLFITGLSVSAFAEEQGRVARVIGVKGVVMTKPAGEDVWIPVADGALLNEGDYIKTGKDSTVRLNLDGTGETALVEVEENSELFMSALSADREKGTQKTLLDLAMGKVLVKAQKLHTDNSRFEVKTPTSIVGVRGTGFSVEVEALE